MRRSLGLSKAQGRMRQHPGCEFCCFSSFFERSSVLKCLGTWAEFLQLVLSSKSSFIKIIDLHSSYPLILYLVSCFVDVSWFIKWFKKKSKHPWSSWLGKKLNYKHLNENNSTTSLNDILFVFKCKENNKKKHKSSYYAPSSRISYNSCISL